MMLNGPPIPNFLALKAQLLLENQQGSGQTKLVVLTAALILDERYQYALAIPLYRYIDHPVAKERLHHLTTFMDSLYSAPGLSELFNLQDSVNVPLSSDQDFLALHQELMDPSKIPFHLNSPLMAAGLILEQSGQYKLAKSLYHYAQEHPMAQKRLIFLSGKEAALRRARTRVKDRDEDILLVFNCITKHQTRRNCFPTLQYIVDETGLKKPSVRQALETLATKKVLHRRGTRKYILAAQAEENAEQPFAAVIRLQDELTQLSHEIESSADDKTEVVLPPPSPPAIIFNNIVAPPNEPEKTTSQPSEKMKVTYLLN